MKIMKILDIILDVILFLLSILIIYWLIELIIGGSPDLSQINSAIIIAITSFLFKMHREIGEIKVSWKYHNLSIKESFGRIKDDMSLLKNDMSLIKKKLKV